MGPSLRFRPLDAIPEVVLVTPRRLDDERGWFAETFRRADFAAAGLPTEFAQEDRSSSASRGTLRGLHYQRAPMAQGKLVQCSRGAIFDVAVDIRKGSPTFGRWVGTELRAEDAATLWIPEGFAHGFLVLSDGADLHYKHTKTYSAPHARRIRWDDPEIGIVWPLGAARPVLSPADAAAPLLRDADLGPADQTERSDGSERRA